MQHGKWRSLRPMQNFSRSFKRPKGKRESSSMPWNRLFGLRSNCRRGCQLSLSPATRFPSQVPNKVPITNMRVRKFSFSSMIGYNHACRPSEHLSTRGISGPARIMKHISSQGCRTSAKQSKSSKLKHKNGTECKPNGLQKYLARHQRAFFFQEYSRRPQTLFSCTELRESMHKFVL